VGYRLHAGEPIQGEVRRIAERQFAQAIEGLRAVGDPESDEVVHTARRHIKKIRALLRLVRPALGDQYDSVNRRLRAVSRVLAPVADGQAIVETLARLAERHRGELPADTLAAVHARLVRREAAADEEAALNDVLGTAAALLRAERDAVSRWTLRETGFRAIAPGLERSAQDGRDAMARALSRFSSARYHAWRQRVKDQWLQVRLLQSRCGGALALHERHLEELDGCLGESHNCAILRDVLTSDAALARDDAALCLRLVRHYERELRAKARELGEQVHAETPRRFVKRVRRLWYAARRSTAREGTSWRPAA
jgi:CHAD domain-containing protein